MFSEKFYRVFSKNTIQTGYHFETFVLKLLQHHLEQQQRNLELGANSSAPYLDSTWFDAYAPEGFDQFDGPTFIEVKLDFKIQHFAKLIPRLFPKLIPQEHSVNFLFVSAKPVDPSANAYLTNQFPNTSMKTYSTWGPQEVEKLALKYPEFTNQLLDNIFEVSVKASLNQRTESWETERDKHLQDLCEAYKGTQLSLFLGAGVSASAGMPDWNNLLNSLFVKLLTKDFDGDENISQVNVRELIQRANTIDEHSALLSARYLRRGLSSSESDSTKFIDAVRSNLYELRDNEKEVASPLIKALATLCTPERTGANIRSVITYNFDDLLERELSERKLRHRSIETESTRHAMQELPIYHVHGFLPETPAGHEITTPESLVFSEEGYHRVYSDPYHWSNLVQLNSLRDNTCLMVGLSMTDPNLRRLLEIAARNLEEPKHFAFMKRISTKQFCAKSEKSEGFSDKKTAKTFLQKHHSLNELVLKELGVTAIWYEDYDEIPELINQIST